MWVYIIHILQTQLTIWNISDPCHWHIKAHGHRGHIMGVWHWYMFNKFITRQGTITYPTLGKKLIDSKVAWEGICHRSQEGNRVISLRIKWVKFLDQLRSKKKNPAHWSTLIGPHVICPDHWGDKKKLYISSSHNHWDVEVKGPRKMGFIISRMVMLHVYDYDSWNKEYRWNTESWNRTKYVRCSTIIGWTHD